MSSLAEELDKLANPEPFIPDTEEFGDSSWIKSQERVESEEVGLGEIRRKAGNVSDDDPRYFGSKISRKQLKEQNDIPDFTKRRGARHLLDSKHGGSSSEDDDDNEAGQDDDDDDGAEASDADDYVIKNDNGYSESTDDEGGDEDDDDADYSDDGEGDELDPTAAVADISERMIEGNTRSGIEEEAEKGKCTVKQLELWDILMKIRIKMQKGLTQSMQLPQPHSWPLFVKELSDPFTQSAGEVKRSLKNLLDQLVQLQTDLLLANSETAAFAKDKTGSSDDEQHQDDDDDDEEIPSDDDVNDEHKDKDEEDVESSGEEDMEADDEELESRMARESVNRRKRRMEDYPQLLAKRHKTFEKYRNDTIQKWQDRVSSKGFGAFDQSVVKQIQMILSDKPRLLTRTILKRSPYTIIGKPDDTTSNITQSGSSTADISGSKSVVTASQKSGRDQYDEEIFDDDDFYHQLLREVISCKTSAIDDPIALSRQWLEMLQLRRKKRAVDTKASKGRRIRYDVHRKLVKFMAPVAADSLTWRDEQRDDLFRSLFAS